MKIILSRKGFDASLGGIPSPIFPDGTLFSFPIPDCSAPITYAQISVQIDGCDFTADKVLSDLAAGKREAGSPCWARERAHLDPDLRAGALRRVAGWRPLFGPGSTVQGHLNANGVGRGDLFLFFGWFRETEWQGDKLTYKSKAPDLHLIFGWLKVGEVWRVGQAHSTLPEYARNHPHAVTHFSPSNTIYAAADGGGGGGAFRFFDRRLQLTARDAASRSVWRLPRWFYRDGEPRLSSHPQRLLATGARRWEPRDDHVRLTSVGRGQEFVLDTDYYPEARSWAENILNTV